MVALRPYRLVAVAATAEARVSVGAAPILVHRHPTTVDDSLLGAEFPRTSYDTDLPERVPGAFDGRFAGEAPHDVVAAPATAPARAGQPGGAVSRTRPDPLAVQENRDTSGFESVIEEIRSQAPVDWLRVVGWTVVGFGTGVAAQSMLGGPVWFWAGTGFAAGWLAAWGHQRWTLRRS